MKQETGLVELTPELVEAFAAAYLSDGYDTPVPPARFHRVCWRDYCDRKKELVAVAAPRAHAKSTALTFDFGTAAAAWRFESHIMIVSSTEEMAMGQLGDIAKEFRENDDLRADFEVESIPTDSKGELIVRFRDGYECRILARGADQRIRGLKWRGRRPGLILLDDVEEDEQVLSKDRRDKFGKWVRRALIPMGRKGCLIRWHGTLLHQDSMLSRLMRQKSWNPHRYRAHRSFDDFSDILWPEAWNEERLRARRQIFIDEQDSAGYAQEYLNDPREDENAFFKKEQFLPFREDDLFTPSINYAGADWAISTKDTANRTAFVCAGATTDNRLLFKDVRKGRWDADEIISELFDFYDTWKPDVFGVEDGQIWKALWPTIRKEMQRRGTYINFEVMTPTLDKAARARPWQKRMKARVCHFDRDASWFPDFEDECLRFTPLAEAALDDQFDAAATMVKAIERMPDVEEEDFKTEDEWLAEREARRHTSTFEGRSAVTGY